MVLAGWVIRRLWFYHFPEVPCCVSHSYMWNLPS